MTRGMPADPRAERLQQSLSELSRRITAACRDAGRSPTELTLVAVTKTYPVADVVRLAALGVANFGENRVPELEEKSGAVPGAVWHFVGRIQSRQAPDVAARAAVVHSVDRAKVALRLGRAAAAAGRRVDAFVQLSFDGDPARGGAVARDLPALADVVAGTPGLRLAGVMGVPPIGADPAASYAELAAMAAELRGRYPAATGLSAGMSGDLEAAIAAGATHLRIGTALLGRRAGVVG